MYFQNGCIPVPPICGITEDPAQNCIVLDLILISPALLCNLFRMFDLRVLQRFRDQTVSLNHLALLVYSFINFHVLKIALPQNDVVFCVCVCSSKKHTHQKKNIPPLQPQFLSPKNKPCWVRSKIMTSEVFIDACGDWMETVQHRVVNPKDKSGRKSLTTICLETWGVLP